jgi:hypothetical protein
MDTNSDILVSERNENRLIKIDKYCNFIKEYKGNSYLKARRAKFLKLNLFLK